MNGFQPFDAPSRDDRGSPPPLLEDRKQAGDERQGTRAGGGVDLGDGRHADLVEVVTGLGFLYQAI
jgi:hypothetical protein